MCNTKSNVSRSGAMLRLRDFFIFVRPVSQARPGRHPAIFDRLGSPTMVELHFWHKAKVWETATRNPLFLLELFGLFLLRLAQRAFLRLLLNEPPRI